MINKIDDGSASLNFEDFCLLMSEKTVEVDPETLFKDTFRVFSKDEDGEIQLLTLSIGCKRILKNYGNFYLHSGGKEGRYKWSKTSRNAKISFRLLKSNRFCHAAHCSELRAKNSVKISRKSYNSLKFVNLGSISQIVFCKCRLIYCFTNSVKDAEAFHIVTV